MKANQILIVDDEPRVVQTFARNLKVAGYKVKSALDGAEAIEIYEEEHPDITLADVRMPKVDGFGVLKKIREDDPHAEVILVTGHGDLDMAIEALRAGASDFIPKPVKPETLETALTRAEARIQLRRELAAAQEALRASEEHYRAITDSAFVGVVIIAPDDKVMFVNQAFADMVGYAPEALMGPEKQTTASGMDWAALTTAEALSQYQTHAEHVQAGQRVQYETILRPQTGHDLNVLLSAAPLREKDGAYKGMLAVITDITERKRAMMALEAERARFKWIVEQSHDGYVMLDAAGNVRYANPQACLYLGRHPDEHDCEATAKNFLTVARRQYQLAPADMWENWPRPLPEDAASPRYLVRSETPSSDVFWLQVDTTESEITEDPAGETYLVRLRDVTSEIVTRNHMWTFESLINYKLRTPLGQLTGFLELLETDLPELTQEEILSDISEARHSAMRLQDKIMDILQYLDTMTRARHEMQQEGACALLHVAKIVEQIAQELELETVKLTYEDLDREEAILPLTCRAAELILRELCENAKKFHPDQAPTLEIRFAAAPKGIRVQVIDDGIHLQPDQLSDIWRPYYQAEPRFTGEVPGMGLGLAVVSSLVWGLGGVRAAYNREDRPGLVIDLMLPVED